MRPDRGLQNGERARGKFVLFKDGDFVLAVRLSV